MHLKAQDVLFLLKLVAIRDKTWSFNKLAIDLGMSPSEVHAASNRVVKAGLAAKQDDRVRPIIGNLLEFLLHGIQYVFVPERGELNKGMPTSYAAAPLDRYFAAANEPPPVWPDPEGPVRGESFSPLYKSAPFAAKKDPVLYELLSLVDAIRGGRAREREMAGKELESRLSSDDGLAEHRLVNNKDNLVIGDAFVVSREALKNLARRYHVRRLVLFGSAARRQLTPDSDIDLLAEFEPGEAPSLGGMVRMQDDFARLFSGRKVDIATVNILKNPYRRRAIERDMEELYAA